jgi:cysteine synthase A
MPHGKIYDNITELVGNTPMVRLHRVPQEGSAEVIVKLEAFEPLSSVKDRIALAMVEDAERRGELRPGSIIVEATSGNTGIGLAFVAAAKGYKCTLVMPDTMSVERRKLLQALGAELILTPGPAGLPFALKTAEEYAKKTPGAWQSKQFDNPANPKVHRDTTAEEIWRDTDGGKLDAIVAGIGTGGTITGTSQVFKKRNSKILTVGVMPVEVQVFKGGPVGPHKIQGIGPTFIPAVYDKQVVDRIFDTTFEQAVETSRKLAKNEGIFVGISSGAVAYAALQIAKELGRGKRVVAVLPDTGERYLSTPLFEYTELVNQPATTPQMWQAQQQAATAAPAAS